MKLTVLGKYGAYPPSGGGTSSYLLREGNTSIALDFGSAAFGRIQKFVDVADLSAVVLSHLHFDHICDIFPLSYYLKEADKKLSVYLPFYESPQLDIIRSCGCFDLHRIKSGEKVAVGELMLEFFETVHPVETYGVRASNGKSSFFYSGDTKFCDSVLDGAKGCKYLLLDCGRHNEKSHAPHLSLSEGMFIGKSCGAKVIVSHCHPAGFYHSADKNVIIAKELETYNLD